MPCMPLPLPSPLVDNAGARPPAAQSAPTPRAAAFGLCRHRARLVKVIAHLGHTDPTHMRRRPHPALRPSTHPSHARWSCVSCWPANLPGSLLATRPVAHRTRAPTLAHRQCQSPSSPRPQPAIFRQCIEVRRLLSSATTGKASERRAHALLRLAVPLPHTQ